MLTFEEVTAKLQEEAKTNLAAHSEEDARSKWAPIRWFNDLKLSKKFSTIFGTFAISLIAVSLVLGVGLTQIYNRFMVSTEIQDAVLQSADLRATIGEARYSSVRFIFGEEEAALDRVNKELGEAEAKAKTIERTVDAHLPMQSVEVDKTTNQLNTYRSKFEELRASLARNGADEGSVSLAYELSREGDALFAQTESLESALISSAGNFESEGLSFFYTLMTWVAVLLFLSLTILVIGFRFLLRDFTAKIQEITDGMQKLTNGAFDFEITGTERKDELGEMLRAMVQFQYGNMTLKKWSKERAEKAEKELELQEKAQREREELEAKKDAELADLAAQFERTVGEVVSGVAAASSQLQSTAIAMAESADESTRQTNDVATSMEEANAGATSAAAASDEFAMSIGEISRQAASSAELARKATGSATKADQTISALSDSADQVGEIVELIHTIAQRTNLLALNASIEAARGGEAGRGFAVVASEVKELAMQTSKATDQVSEQIRSMQETTVASVSALRSIANQVEQLETTSVSIASAVDQQSVAGQDLARSIDLAARSSERVSSNISDVRALSLSTGAAASQVLSSSTDLEAQASTLRQQADDFLKKIRGK